LAITDITKKKRDEAEHLKLEKQLRQKYKMEAVGIMAGGMAHNFNNNLSIILGNIELLKLKIPETPGIDGYLEDSKTAVLRSRDLIKQILLYSRQEEQNRKPLQLSLLVDETLQLLRSTIPTTISLQKKISADAQNICIHADASQLQECLINLCNNAMQAMDEKGELTISLETVALREEDIPVQYDATAGHYAKLCVADTGCGISAETIDKIFDLFYTTKSVDEGTGVGLSTVQGIVKQHGGLINVKSALGEGTSFELYFPAIKHQDQELQAVSEGRLEGTEHILLIDDNEMLVELGNRMLTEMGYRVTMMTDSQQALNLFTSDADRFDLVMTDQTMPGMTGKELIEEIKKVRSDIPTILCTGYSSKIDEKEAAKLGIGAFLMKPLELPMLLQTIRRLLDGEDDTRHTN
jgi:nitrogen-specific signal transduction histidine kinase/ActR/RegA family two-component response regulator